MRRVAQVSFLGPVAPERGASGRITGWAFLVVQAGSDPVKLEYPSRKEAHAARSLMGQAEGTHVVRQEKLFAAIAVSVEEAATLAKQEAEVPDAEPGDDQGGEGEGE